MRAAKIIIGSSYGDEGKGLATAFFARNAVKPCLNIMINGGAQRGHTVDFPDGRRHVFHHFGSGTFEGAVSCADEEYIVNPLVFVREREELVRDFGIRPRLLVSARCRLSTPWDMMLGQIIEENRGAKRHGSCGMGIQETRLRFLNTDWALPWGKAMRITREDFVVYCRRIAGEYVPQRLGEMKMTAGSEWQDILRDGGIIQSAWDDLCRMREQTEVFADWAETAEKYPYLIFEAGQGLSLDAENRQDFPYLTPSRTTSLISAKRVAALPGLTRTEIVYVTRSYLTRHGAGPFPTECGREEIGENITDRTNVPNPHQQTLRYGLFDGPAVLSRIRADREATRKVLPEATAAALVTHLNETGGELRGNIKVAEFIRHFDRAYLSDSPWDISC